MSAAFVNALIAALVASALIMIQLAISGTRLVFCLPAYALLAVCALLLPFGRRPGREPSKWCLFAVAVFFTYILARASQSPVEYLSRMDIYMVLACLAAYAASAFFMQRPGVRVAFMVCMFGLAVAEVVFGVRQFGENGDNGWMPFGFLRDAGERASGSFISPIHLAGFLEAVAPFAIAIAIWGTQRAWARWLLGYIALLCYVGVAITGSRGGWISSVGSLLVLLVLGLIVTFRTNRARFPSAVYAAILMLLVVPAVSFPLMMKSDMLRQRLEKLSDVQTVGTGKSDIRLANWAAAIDQWRVAPVYGTGAGTHLYYGRLFRRPELQPDPEHAHGDYLELLAEYGIVGAVGMGVFLLAHGLAGFAGFRRLIAVRAEDRYSSGMQLAFNIGTLTAVAAHVAHAVVDFNMHLPGNAIFLAVLFGFLANSGDIEEPPVPSPNLLPDAFYEALPKEEPKPPEPAPQWSVASKIALWMSAGIGVAICAIALPKFPGEYWCEKSRVAVRNKQFEEAIEYGKKSLEWEQGNPFTHFQIGQAHRGIAEQTLRALRKPHYEAAIVSFEKGLKLFPQDETLWVRYAQALEGSGQFVEAGAAYREAINLDPNLGVIRSFYSRFLARMGREAEAQEQAAFASKASSMNLAPISVYQQLTESELESDQQKSPE